MDRFAIGARIGDYVVEHEVGSEQAGMVYLGRHVVLPRLATIKVMHASGAWIRQVAVQMLKEACLVEALSHPGIPRVFECGVLADRRPWTAFEHVEGESVAAQIVDRPLAVADVVVLVRDVADLLDHIHRRGIVHRALTADALIRTPDRRSGVRVVQWAHACALDAEAGARVDPRDDVHALGVIAFRALTGARADSVGPMVERFIEATAERYPGAPRDVAQLVDGMLARDPHARPTSAEVRDRATWLANTLELVPSIDKPRWTPPHGLDDSIPASIEEAAAGFSIRIAGRTRTR